MASVDVVVPCYNYGRYLNACVQSVLSQPGVDVRVIIIDDQSSDNTPEVGSELARTDKRVEFHRHAVNKKHIATYNEGLEMVRADYSVLLSADDMLTPGALQRATGLMEAHPNVGFVYGHPISLYGEVPPVARTRVSGHSVWTGAQWISHMCQSGRNFIVSPEVVMRAKVQHQIGGYLPNLPHSGDMEMWMRAAAVSDVGYVRGTDQAYYRIHSASMQRTVHAGFVFDLQGRLDAYETVLNGVGAHLPDAGSMLASARKALALIAVDRARRAFEHGRAGEEPIDDYCNFAKSVYPAIEKDKTWRSLNRIRDARPTLLTQLTSRGLVGYRRVQDHLAWRQWLRTGLY